MLAKMRKTSPGKDEIPYWVYRDCARGLANVVTKIINFHCLPKPFHLPGG